MPPIHPNVRILIFALCILHFALPSPSRAATDIKWGGHLKLRTSASRPDDDSIYQFAGVRDYYDGAGDFRLKNEVFFGNQFFLETHYEALLSGGDTRRKTIEICKRTSLLSSALADGEITDDRRLFDLAKTADETDDYILRHRLDRLYLKYLPAWGAVSVGRQALTWGNGLLFNPMDLFNPFAPTDIQRDYKVGDDMAVVQFHAGQTGDVQLLCVPRRDSATGDAEWDQSSLAGKLHVMKAGMEFDVMAGKHYTDHVLGLGASGYVKNAAWRMDAVYTFLDDDGDQNGALGFVANLDYSWVWLGKNMYGLVEFYFNSLGDDDYAAALEDPAIVERLGRGELFTLGRAYLTGQIQAELHPLVNIYLTVIANLHDPSAVLQPRITWDILENIQFIIGANLYAGETGSEFGGFAFQGTDVIQKSADSLFSWATWYF